MKEQIVFVIIGLILSKLTKQHYTADCICGELLGIGFLIVMPYILWKFYGMIHIEPFEIARLLLLGYLPGRVIDWMRSEQ